MAITNFGSSKPVKAPAKPASNAQLLANQAAILANTKKGTAAAHANLAQAKADQADTIKSNTTLAGTEGGTINPATGHITLPTTGPVFPAVPLTGSDVPITPPDPIIPPIGTEITSGTQLVLNWLTSIGLGSIAPIVKGWGDKGYSFDTQLDMIRNSPETRPTYIARFPAISALQKNDPSMSEGQYIAKENADRSMLYQYLGDSAKAYDNTNQLGTLMTNMVGTNELQTRLQAIHDEVNSSADTKAWMKNAYGLSDQDVAAAWLDPKLASDQVALRDQSGGIGGAGTASGFGTLTQAQAEALASGGVTQSQAQNTFAKIGNYGQLERNLPGNDSGSLTQQQIIDGAFNGGAAGQTLQNAQSARLAQFQSGGGMAADSSGVIGDRNANTQ